MDLNHLKTKNNTHYIRSCLTENICALQLERPSGNGSIVNGCLLKIHKEDIKNLRGKCGVLGVKAGGMCCNH